MNAVPCFFRLCRQRQLQLNLAAPTRHIPRCLPILQRRTFVSSSRRYAEPIAPTTRPDPPNSELSTENNQTTLFCGNLAFGVEHQTILNAFGKFGTVKTARTGERYTNRPGNGWGGYNGGYCFIEFASHEEAGAALKALNGADISGLPINLGWARPPTPKLHKEEGLKKRKQAQDEEYMRTQPLVTGTVSRTGTMTKTVAVTTNHRRLDKYTQTHHVQEETKLVHDPKGILVEGDVIKYQHFPPNHYADRITRGKGKVKFVLREVVTAFGIPVEERTSNLGPEHTPEKKSKRRESRDRSPAIAAS
jgi:hypothetical protein